ncbi:arylamine N-acetyltransferase [Shimazuella sp. AN120528]|uniref:arylamine N-acetyltransferase family protein n=1 Tax=Shimazuella soli TaxID=1892854 RepID=UPI001F109A2F|nr:arylamine N-acetyltransferase [Shimazuella soli]MCH5585818.1 arylamine N-acetyltransferase [Shimazuella soli]
MGELDALFRSRIGIPKNEKITFEKLDNILEKTAKNIPFENLCIMENRIRDITKENLISKILVRREGGLCYELNSIFYFFLIENGFDAVLASGIVYDHTAQEYPTLGRTHVTILVTYEGRIYLIDTGFGGNLPLKPVPLSGEIVTSSNGQFRIKKNNGEHGDYVFEMKLKYKDSDWRVGYAFYSNKITTDVSEFNEIQTIIAENQESRFNKNPLITRLTNEGSITLTDSSFTQWRDGVVTKEKVDKVKFKAMRKQYFGL